jgi:hypothetical protein
MYLGLPGDVPKGHEKTFVVYAFALDPQATRLMENFRIDGGSYHLSQRLWMANGHQRPLYVTAERMTAELAVESGRKGNSKGGGPGRTTADSRAPANLARNVTSKPCLILAVWGTQGAQDSVKAR